MVNFSGSSINAANYFPGSSKSDTDNFSSGSKLGRHFLRELKNGHRQFEKITVPIFQPPEKLSVAIFELLEKYTVALFELPEKLPMWQFYNSWGPNLWVSFASFPVNNANLSFRHYIIIVLANTFIWTPTCWGCELPL